LPDTTLFAFLHRYTWNLFSRCIYSYTQSFYALQCYGTSRHWKPFNSSRIFPAIRSLGKV